MRPWGSGAPPDAGAADAGRGPPDSGAADAGRGPLSAGPDADGATTEQTADAGRGPLSAGPEIPHPAGRRR